MPKSKEKSKNPSKKVTKTRPYVGQVNGELGVYCIKCDARLDVTDKICPGCLRAISEF